MKIRVIDSQYPPKFEQNIYIKNTQIYVYFLRN
jgi:hypothetical protein